MMRAYKNKQMLAPMSGAVIATTLIITVIFSLLSAILDAGFAGWSVIIVPFIFLFVLIHTIIGSLIFLFIHKHEKENIIWIIILGAIVGVVPSLLFIYFSSNTQPVSSFNDLLALSEMAILGSFGAIIFKKIWKFLLKNTDNCQLYVNEKN